MECRGLTFLLGIAVGGLVLGESPRANVAKHIIEPVQQESQITQDQMVGFVPHLITDKEYQ